MKLLKRKVHSSDLRRCCSETGVKVFSKLDASSGYWQIPLQPESSRLTTFITPSGHYCFRRLPFGITSASDISQKRMTNLLKDQEGVAAIQDDIIFLGRTVDEHGARLQEVFVTVAKSGRKLNEKKCDICKRKICNFGNVMSKERVSPDPEKVSYSETSSTKECSRISSGARNNQLSGKISANPFRCQSNE